MAPIFTGRAFGFGRSAADSGPTAKATGGTVVYNTDIQKNVHVFTALGTFTPLFPAPFTVDYFVVAGGGGGSGGAGGAGGLKQGTFTATSGSSYTITVGGGAPGGRVSGSLSSIATGPTVVVQSSGGGGGGVGVPGFPTTAPPDINALPGGSGGGGGWRLPPLDNNGAGGNGVPGEGFPGGSGRGNPPASGAGGGGAGGAGSPGSPGSPPGAGGIGASTNIAPPSYGTPGPTPGRWFAGGGGTGGGEGGGGPGPGDTNTGGGGAPGSAGGSGIVIVAYTL